MSPVRLRRRRRATLRLYTSAVRKGIRVPKMLTVEEEFEAIISGVDHEAKMRPLEDPEPKEGVPAEKENKPVEKEEK